ncbi:Nucleoside phosphatase GDA1/CD39 [Dillenia turbinata]|uniref:Nucleoside phosphatase GDA1/CD39 n=1 Tax=Dillenia turbinata TaxID=194707 RepID=A0AAN8VK85_9MAGN
MDSNSMKLQFTPRRSTNLLSSKTPNSKDSKSTLFFYSSIAISLALFSYIFLVSKPSSSNASQKTSKFRIVIDGGSTGTRIHVFEYTIDGKAPIFEFGEKGLATMKVSPGLSAYAAEPEKAGTSILEQLEFAKKRVGREFWGSTEIRLMATAGLRMLDLGVQEQILESCRRVLRVSGFRFKNEWAEVITGSDEGVYAWVVANYALGALGKDPQETTGIIELGGASAQVTFVSPDPVPFEFSRRLIIGNVSYNLYSHSLLHFGQNVALQSLHQSLVSGDIKFDSGAPQKQILIDPCSPKGYKPNFQTLNLHLDSSNEKIEQLSMLHARGNFSECRSAALALLQKGKDLCSYQHCSVGSTFVPKLQGKFLATENFFYTSKRFCEEDWSNLKRKYQSFDEDALVHYCFSSAYIVALLHDGFGIPMEDARIKITNQVENVPLDWALGAFILQSTTSLKIEQSSWISTFISDGSSTLLSLVVISILLMFVAWLISKLWKPQLKTIYDLENGRYIFEMVFEVIS